MKLSCFLFAITAAAANSNNNGLTVVIPRLSSRRKGMGQVSVRETLCQRGTAWTARLRCWSLLRFRAEGYDYDMTIRLLVLENWTRRLFVVRRRMMIVARRIVHCNDHTAGWSPCWLNLQRVAKLVAAPCVCVCVCGCVCVCDVRACVCWC